MAAALNDLGYKNPLNTKHCECIDRVIKQATEMRQLIEDCKSCGLQLPEAEERNNNLLSLATKLKAKFFPDRP